MTSDMRTRGERALVRAAVALAVALFAETALRAIMELPMAPGLAAMDLFARAGRLAVLVGVILAADLGLAVLEGRVESVGRFADRARGWFAALARLAPTSRAVGLFLIAATALTLTVGQRYDLRWRAGVVFALPVLVVAALTEVALGFSRRARWGRPSVLAHGAWAAVALSVGLLVAPRVLGLAPLIFFSLVVVAAAVPVRGGRRAAGLAVAVLAIAALGVFADAARPSVRRLSTVHTPFSGLGLRALLAVTDLDRDGSSGLLGLDCDDLSPEQGPLFDDLPDDGLDQNCTGADASKRATMARWASGGPREPWPPSPLAKRPDVIVVTVDALRADSLDPAAPGFAMPETAAWAEGCVRMRQARTAATFTDLSLVALWTGMHPRHLLRDGSLTMAPGDPAKGRLPVPPTVASALHRAGWRSAAVVTFDPVRPYLVAGFDRVLSSGRPEVQAPPASEVLDAARRAFFDLAGAPRLLWVHLMDPHAPYQGGEDRAAYDREVAALDAPLAAFLESLPHDAIVVLTSDHGEAFGEHGHYTHGNTLFDEEVRVPLVLCVPEGALGPPRDVETPVSLVDVAPTLLDLTGATAPYPRHGESLVRPLREGAPLRSPWVLFEVWLPHAHAQGILLGCDVWLRDLDREWEALFDRCDDPGQTRDLLMERRVVADELRALFFTVLDQDLDAFRSWRL